MVYAEVATGHVTFLDGATGATTASEAAGGGHRLVPAADPGDPHPHPPLYKVFLNPKPYTLHPAPYTLHPES